MELFAQHRKIAVIAGVKQGNTRGRTLDVYAVAALHFKQGLPVAKQPRIERRQDDEFDRALVR